MRDELKASMELIQDMQESMRFLVSHFRGEIPYRFKELEKRIATVQAANRKALEAADAHGDKDD